MVTASKLIFHALKSVRILMMQGKYYCDMNMQIKAGSLRVELSETIPAKAKRVINIYRDFSNWHKLFPLTIKGTKLLKQNGEQETIEVDHKQEGKVINVLSVLSDEEIRLDEFKPKFDAVFINKFEQAAENTRYIITAYISLKGFYKLFRPFVTWLVKSRIRRFVLQPMKHYVQELASQNPRSF